MKQFKTIFAFEFSGYLKNKVFVGLTVIMVLITAVFLFSPRFSSTGSFNVDDAVVSSDVILVLQIRNHAIVNSGCRSKFQ